MRTMIKAHDGLSNIKRWAVHTLLVDVKEIHFDEDGVMGFDKWTGKTGKVMCIGKWILDYQKVVSFLGEEHFIEENASRTHSGTERLWVFKLEEDVALAFQFDDFNRWLLVGSNKPDLIPLNTINKFISFPYQELSGTMWD